jgi:hypothetical protein
METTNPTVTTKITHHCSECGVEYPDGNNLCHPSAVVESVVSSNRKIAIVGDGGLAPVVWGLGATEEIALQNANDSDVDNVGWDSLGWASLEVGQDVVARIESGVVDCYQLGIDVKCDGDGRILDAAVRS